MSIENSFSQGVNNGDFEVGKSSKLKEVLFSTATFLVVSGVVLLNSGDVKAAGVSGVESEFEVGNPIEQVVVDGEFEGDTESLTFDDEESFEVAGGRRRGRVERGRNSKKRRVYECAKKRILGRTRLQCWPRTTITPDRRGPRFEYNPYNRRQRRERWRERIDGGRYQRRRWELRERRRIRYNDKLMDQLDNFLFQLKRDVPDPKRSFNYLMPKILSRIDRLDARLDSWEWRKRFFGKGTMRVLDEYLFLVEEEDYLLSLRDDEDLSVEGRDYLSFVQGELDRITKEFKEWSLYWYALLIPGFEFNDVRYVGRDGFPPVSNQEKKDNVEKVLRDYALIQIQMDRILSKVNLTESEQRLLGKLSNRLSRLEEVLINAYGNNFSVQVDKMKEKILQENSEPRSFLIEDGVFKIRKV